MRNLLVAMVIGLFSLGTVAYGDETAPPSGGSAPTEATAPAEPAKTETAPPADAKPAKKAGKKKGKKAKKAPEGEAPAPN